MFSSICNYVKHKLAKKELADLAEHKLAVENFTNAINTYEGACNRFAQELTEYKQALSDKSEQLAAVRAELESTQHQLESTKFELESVQQPVVVKEQVWVMAPEVFKKFAASFEPPVINGNSHPDEAGYKLGIQRVLSRISEQYVSR